MTGGAVERWSVSVNGYYGVARIQKDRGWAWWFFLEWMADHVCHFFYWLPGHWWICSTLHSPITSWCYKHYTNVGVDIPLGDIIIAWKSEAPAWWTQEWERGTDMWKEYGEPKNGIIYRTANAVVHSRPRFR